MTPSDRRPAVRRALGLALAACCAGASAQDFPARPIRWIVPSAPGGAYDIVARALAPGMVEDLGQPVVVENRAGAGGIIGLESVARSAPDGYTIVAGGISQMVLNPLFHARTPYNTLSDFTPIGLVGDLVMGLYVHGSLGVSDLKGLLEYARNNPGKVAFGSSGVGQSFHLAGEMLALRGGVRFTHVPYKGNAQALQDFYAGRLQMMFYPPANPVLAQIRSGAIRPIAAMSEKRLAKLPEVPTFDETGLGNLGVSGWGGVEGPAGLPRNIVLRLNQALNKSSLRPEMARTYDALTMVPIRSTPEDLAERIRSGHEFWSVMIKKLGIKPES